MRFIFLLFLAIKAVAILALVLDSTPAWACNFDTDCAVGSKCLKTSGSLQGICAGGMSPGNQYDANPYRDSLNPKRGNTCSSNFDCAVGSKCLKSGLYGVCVN